MLKYALSFLPSKFIWRYGKSNYINNTDLLQPWLEYLIPWHHADLGDSNAVKYIYIFQELPTCSFFYVLLILYIFSHSFKTLLSSCAWGPLPQLSGEHRIPQTEGTSCSWKVFSFALAAFVGQVQECHIHVAFCARFMGCEMVVI